MLKKVCTKIDDIKQPQKIIAGFLLIWFIINLLQSVFTELAHDEAYYWLYSRKLAWGYFDHPPMVAVLVKLGAAIFNGELGVRFIMLLLGTGTIYLIYLLTRNELSNLSTFLLIASSTIILKSHVGGFLAIPDVPVIFFAALFFYLYKLYLQKDTLLYALLLGIVATAMLYSKYHGVLVLLFTLTSNLRMLRRSSFYIIPVCIVLGMLPHLFWQIENNFPTFAYHLVGRSSPYKIDHTLNYLISQLLIAGPFIGIILFAHSIKRKINGDIFLRAMKYNFYGFFVFFFFMSFKGHTEAHWTAIAFIPVLVLSIKSINESETALLWLRRLFLPVVVIFLVIRVSLVVEILPRGIHVGHEFHHWDDWAQEIKATANGRKVVFNSTFQRPSKYSFYTGGEFAHSLNQLWYRKNQFDVWGYTDSIQGEDIILFRVGKSRDSIFTKAENESYWLMNDFESYDNIPIIIDDGQLTAKALDSIYVSLKVINNRSDNLVFKADTFTAPRYVVSYYNGKRFSPRQYSNLLDFTLAPGDTIQQRIKIIAPEQPGKYSCYISIVNDNLRPGFNGRPVELLVR